jgi:site-specific recombinase XerD
MAHELTIEDGIEAFISEFDFHGRENTRRAYLRAAKLFQDYLKSPDGACQTTDITPVSLLSDLPDTIFAGFMSWLRKQTYEVGKKANSTITFDTSLPSPIRKKYSNATINLYETALQRMFQFWRVRNWLTFSEISQKEVAKASGITLSKKDRSFNRRASAVPEDFGLVLLRTARETTTAILKDEKATRSDRLEALRAQCLVHVMMASGLRASDTATLTIRDVEMARSLDGYLMITMKKTHAQAYCYFTPPVFESIDAYLNERNDRSPWLLIQHGRSGKIRSGTSDYFANNTIKGYGAPISTTTVWRIVHSIAASAGYSSKDQDIFISPHAIRHWFAQSLRAADVPIDDIQSALGHASSETTKTVYAPLPNLKRLIQVQAEIQKAADNPQK